MTITPTQARERKVNLDTIDFKTLSLEDEIDLQLIINCQKGADGPILINAYPFPDRQVSMQLYDDYLKLIDSYRDFGWEITYRSYPRDWDFFEFRTAQQTEPR